MVCTACEIDKDLEDFPNRTGKSNVSFRPSGRGKICKKCNALRAKEWRKANPDYRKNTSTKWKGFSTSDRLLMSAISSRLTEAKGRTKKRNLPEITITREWLFALYKIQDGKCAISGIEMSLVKATPNTLSLDQILPGKGYTKDNTQWVTNACNRAKSDLTQSEFISLCNTIVTNQIVGDSDEKNKTTSASRYQKVKSRLKQLYRTNSKSRPL